MRILRSKKSVDEMVELARVYCSMLMAYRLEKEHGTLSSNQEVIVLRDLAEIETVLTRLKDTTNRTVRTKIPALKIVASGLHTKRQNHDRKQHSA